MAAFMATFLFRCPNTGLRVQGWAADDAPPPHNDGASRDDDRYEAITCLACQGVHLVNPSTGKVVGRQSGPP